MIGHAERTRAHNARTWLAARDKRLHFSIVQAVVGLVWRILCGLHITYGGFLDASTIREGFG